MNETVHITVSRPQYAEVMRWLARAWLMGPWRAQGSLALAAWAMSSDWQRPGTP